jgi:hypothetical protein
MIIYHISLLVCFVSMFGLVDYIHLLYFVTSMYLSFKQKALDYVTATAVEEFTRFY